LKTNLKLGCYTDINIFTQGSRGSSVSTATRLWVGRAGLDFRQR